MVMEIQRLSLDEAARLRSIQLAALHDAPQAFGTTFQTAVRLSTNTWLYQLQIFPTFVAVVDGIDSGMVRSARNSNDVSSAYLISLWVAPQARRLGVGSMLIDTVVAWGRSVGYARLLLEVAEKNGHAISLYTGKGFKPTGQTRALPPPREHIKEQEMELLL